MTKKKSKPKTASGTAQIASGTPRVASGTPKIGKKAPGGAPKKPQKSSARKLGEALEKKRRQRDMTAEELLENPD